MLHNAPVAGHHRLQHCAPALGAVHIARPQGAALDIAELVEHEQRVITGAAEMPVVGAALLLAVGGALARIHVERDGGRRWCTLSIHWPDRSASAARFWDRLNRFVSKRPIWLAEAANPVIALSPTTQRIAGSQHSLSASFISS
jgi:hypothetical protein